MSNIIDAYCVYNCAQEIKRSTEASREMISERSYINRKRYLLLEIKEVQSVYSLFLMNCYLLYVPF